MKMQRWNHGSEGKIYTLLKHNIEHGQSKGDRELYREVIIARHISNAHLIEVDLLLLLPRIQDAIYETIVLGAFNS